MVKHCENPARVVLRQCQIKEGRREDPCRGRASGQFCPEWAIFLKPCWPEVNQVARYHILVYVDCVCVFCCCFFVCLAQAQGPLKNGDHGALSLILHRLICRTAPTVVIQDTREICLGLGNEHYRSSGSFCQGYLRDAAVPNVLLCHAKQR